MQLGIMEISDSAETQITFDYVRDDGAMQIAQVQMEEPCASVQALRVIGADLRRHWQDNQASWVHHCKQAQYPCD